MTYKSPSLEQQKLWGQRYRELFAVNPRLAENISSGVAIAYRTKYPKNNGDWGPFYEEGLKKLEMAIAPTKITAEEYDDIMQAQEVYGKLQP